MNCNEYLVDKMYIILEVNLPCLTGFIQKLIVKNLLLYSLANVNE